MKTIKNRLFRTLGATALSLAALGVGAAGASAADRPAYCPDRDRSDRYVQDVNNDGSYSRYDSRYDNRRDYGRFSNGYRYGDRRVLSRVALDTRYRARIVVREEIVYGPRRSRLVCTVTPRGRDAAFIPYKRLKRAAFNNCSPRARVTIRA